MGEEGLEVYSLDGGGGGEVFCEQGECLEVELLEGMGYLVGGEWRWICR